MFEENLNSISSLKDNINERLSISSSKISSKTLKFFEIRSLVRVKKFDEDLFKKNLSEIVLSTEKQYRDILKSRISVLIKSDDIQKQIIKNEIKDLNYTEYSLTMDYTNYLNSSINKNLLIKGHQALLDQTKI